MNLTRTLKSTSDADHKGRGVAVRFRQRAVLDLIGQSTIRAALVDRIAALDAQQAIALSTDFEDNLQVGANTEARDKAQSAYV
jgi:hypothetical protein